MGLDGTVWYGTGSNGMEWNETENYRGVGAGGATQRNGNRVKINMK